MKKTLFAMLLTLAFGGAAWAHEGHDAEHGEGGKEVAFKGELIDMACYMAHEGKGKKHADCGKMCAQGGAPMGILTTDGKVYLLVEDHSTAKAKKPYAKAKDMIADMVTVKGDLYERGGAQAVVVESVTKE